MYIFKNNHNVLNNSFAKDFKVKLIINKPLYIRSKYKNISKTNNINTNSLDTFKMNKNKYRIKLKEINICKKLKLKLKNRNISNENKKKIISKEITNIYSKNQTFNNNSNISLVSIKNKKSKIPKKKIFFNNKKIFLNKNQNDKHYESVLLKTNCSKINKLKNFNNYFKHEYKVKQRSISSRILKNNKNNIPEQNKLFNLTFKKKEIEELIQFENSLLNKKSDFKMLDKIFKEYLDNKMLEKLKFKFYRSIHDKIKRDSINNLNFIKNINNEVFRKKIINWPKIFKNIWKFCLKDRFNPNKNRVSIGSLNFIDNNRNSHNNFENFSSRKIKKKIKTKIKIKKSRIFNRENKLINNNYISTWLNIIENLLYNRTVSNEIGYYKLKGYEVPKTKTKKVKKDFTMLDIKEEKFNIKNFINKIQYDINFDHSNFNKLI